MKGNLGSSRCSSVTKIYKLLGRVLIGSIVGTSFLAFMTLQSVAADPKLEKKKKHFLMPDWVGTHLGMSAYDSPLEFHQAEAAIGYKLPWRWELGRTRIGLGTETTAGWLGDNNFHGVVVTSGPVAKLQWQDVGLVLTGGSVPTYISRDVYRHRDLGSNIQFTTHVGLGYEFTEKWGVGYRFQHMSNAGIARPNPGLNLHMVSVKYQF